jgi:membrane protein implicated in regulation of membrane protease activity
MNLDFLSGLLLTAAALAVLVFLLKETVVERISGQKKAQRYLGDALTKVLGGEAKPVNAHMIGAIGEVIESSGDSARPMRVRVSAERWPARLGSTEDIRLTVGTAIKVIAIDGAVLVVEAAGAPTE